MATLGSILYVGFITTESEAGLGSRAASPTGQGRKLGQEQAQAVSGKVY